MGNLAQKGITIGDSEKICLLKEELSTQAENISVR
ncbi:Uncharacterised protein [Chlamydia abortus]|nr:Uncharacterised protein [Chlamydia abortus]